MKMKTKFFGMSAKLALAILAVSGGLFTSCYDSVESDITAPYVAPDAVYSITGTVTNLATGLPVSGVIVTFGGPASVSAQATSIAGSYSVPTTVAGSYTISVDAATAGQYDIASATTLAINALQKGQSATYMCNVVLAPKGEAGFKGLKITQTSAGAGTSAKTFDATTDTNVDIVNNGSSFMNVTFNVKLDKGAKFVFDDLGIEPAVRSVDIEGLKTYVKNYLKAIYGGTLPYNHNDKYDLATKTVTFQLAPQSSLKTFSATTMYVNDTYTFIYNNTTYTIVICSVAAYEYTNTQYSNDIYHGNGHGHGHGGDLNAGGGIITPEV